MQAFNFYGGLMDRNLPLKITFWAFLSLLSLSILFSILYPIVGCGVFGFDMPCSHFMADNPNACHIGSSDYCCGSIGSIVCVAYTNCQEAPTPFSIPKCAGILITSWTLEILTIIASVVLVWLCVRARNAHQRGEDYQQMGNA